MSTQSAYEVYENSAVCFRSSQEKPLAIQRCQVDMSLSATPFYFYAPVSIIVHIHVYYQSLLYMHISAISSQNGAICTEPSLCMSTNLFKISELNQHIHTVHLEIYILALPLSRVLFSMQRYSTDEKRMRTLKKSYSLIPVLLLARSMSVIV